MNVSIENIVGWSWMMIGALWLASAFFTKHTVRMQSRDSRMVQAVLSIAAFVLLFKGHGWNAPGNIAILPAAPPVQFAGLALLFLGLAFAIWARLIIGDNWSSSVTLKHGHTLVRSGPYSIVRHPIYTGMLVAMLGTAITYGRLYSLLSVPVAILAWKLKSLTEESFMLQQFGPQYADYRQQVKALVPFVW